MKNTTQKSSYNVMKEKYEAEISNLIKEIEILVRNEDIEKVYLTKIKWKTHLDMQKVVWDRNANKKTETNE